jgi:hypothetical protein
MTKVPKLYTLHALQPAGGNSWAPLRYNNRHKLRHAYIHGHSHTRPSPSLTWEEISLHAFLYLTEILRDFSLFFKAIAEYHSLDYESYESRFSILISEDKCKLLLPSAVIVYRKSIIR